MSDWIDCKERLPEPPDVLVWMAKPKKWSIGRVLGGRWWVTGWGSRDDVTHWMPIPDPPKLEEPAP